MTASKPKTVKQVSAGGVVYREGDAGIEVVLIRVGEADRWQLPKGIVEADEETEATALREVREETGLETEPIVPIDTIEYWYFGSRGRSRVRFHKFVHFYLLEYRASGTREEDQEGIKEVRWMPLDEAEASLAFDNEKEVLRRAREIIAGTSPSFGRA